MYQCTFHTMCYKQVAIVNHSVTKYNFFDIKSDVGKLVRIFLRCRNQQSLCAVAVM